MNTAAQTSSVSLAIAKDIREKLLAWYGRNGRQLPWRQTSDPYRIWVSEIMLQQTRVQTVIPYYERFLARFPDICALAAADQEVLLKLWEGLGYYARARNMHKAAKRVVAEHGGKIPDNWPAIIGLPGIGPYVAAAVLSFAFDRPHAVLDGNVKRLIARLFADAEPVNRPAGHGHFQRFADDLLDTARPADYNQAVMELGALVCRPKSPLCDVCPLASHCRARAADAVGDFPVRGRRKPVPEYEMAIGVIRRNGRYLVVRRPENGLLGGLWEFPGAVLENGKPPADACIRSMKAVVNLSAAVARPICTVRHAYTHFKVRAHVFLCRQATGSVQLSGPAACRWVPPSNLRDLPFTGLTHKFLAQVVEGKL
ncbi:MAG: A/G-specific adenine glycosylase [Thermodesulfobacteriota bacterium]